MKLSALIFFIFFLLTIDGYGQAGSCGKSTEGKDFWIGFMEGRTWDVTHYVEITVTSSYNCRYKIYIGKSTIPYTLPFPLDGTVLPNIPVKILIDWRQVEATGSENIQEKAIHLVSDNPLNVYALNFSTNSSEVALIFPTTSLGNEYFAMCYEPHCSFPSGVTQGKNSEFLIVATEDSTIVNITPTRVTDKLKPAYKPFSIKLSRGELYQVQSGNLPNLTGQGDLTGSYITSDKPIALFSGSYSTTIPFSSINAWDHLYEQMPPVQSWGRKFVAVPLRTRHEDTYRILAAEDNTTVRIGNKVPVVLNKGNFYEFMLLYTEISLIESDKPVLLAQYSNSNSVDYPFNGGDGDPFMVIVGPVNQTREKVAFIAYDSRQITRKFFINVIVRDDAVGKIKLDNALVSFMPVGGSSGYSYAQVSILKGNHFIESTEPGKGFIAYVYGFGGVEAYGYGVGYNLDIVLDLGSNINAVGKLLVRCEGDPPLTINAGNAFDKYLWNTGDTTSVIQVSKAGWYKVTASINEGCKLVDSVEVRNSKPVVFLGRDTTICNPSTAVLNAGAGEPFSGYMWSNGRSDQRITVSLPGSYSVVATNLFGCKARDTIKVSFADKPKLDISRLQPLMCGKYSTTVDITADKNVTWLMESVNPKVRIKDMTASVSPSDYGIYPITLTAKDQNACAVTTAFSLGFYPTPSVNLGRDTTICNPANIQLNAGTGFAGYLWSTGETTPAIIVKNNGIYSVSITDKNGCKTSDEIKVSFTNKPKLDLSGLQALMCGKYSTTVDIKADKNVTWLMESNSPKVKINNLTATVSSADFGTYPMTLTAKDEYSCAVNTSFNLGFYATPTVNLGRDTTICNPANIQLNAGAGFAGYLWSTIETTPTIIVRNNGIYSVNVTDKNGCKASDDIRVSFTNKPKLDLSKLQTLMCGKYSTTVDITADKSVTWLMESVNPKVIIKDLTASVSPADFGTYPVTITAKDEFACATTASFKLGFYKVPNVDFTIDAKICSGYNLNATYVGDADPSISNFKWVFGGKLVADRPGLSSLIVPLGINRSQRDLSLTVTQDGCPNTYTQKDIKVIPNLDLRIVKNLGCEPFNAEFVAENTETVVYDWDFGDGTPVERTGKQPFHKYQNDGFYDVKLKVTTIVPNGEGCVNEVKIDSFVHVAPIPTSGFTSLPPGCLSLGDHRISYSGTGDSLDRYIWDLSKFDGTEIIINPGEAQGPFIFNLRNKPQAGIGLKVISKYGCQSDNATVTVKRIPDFSVHASSNAGCTPFGPLFTGTTGDPVDKVSYRWDFGDGATGSGDSIKHTYVVPDRRYDIVLTALSSATGCTDTLYRPAYMVTYPIPTSGFTPLPAECLTRGDHTVSYSGTGDTMDRYIWDLSKFDGEEIIKNPGETQGPFIFNLKNKPLAGIGLKVISKYGCHSEGAAVVVKRVPSFSVQVSSNAGCPPFEPLFTGMTGDPVDKVGYSWDFGDGATGAGPEVKHVYQIPDRIYGLVLTASSSTTGCTDTIYRPAYMRTYPIPTAGFTPLPAECLPQGDHTVSYSGTGDTRDRYIWDLSKFDGAEIIKNPGETQGPFIFNLKNKPQAVIGLKVVSRYGCHSEGATVVVKRVPAFSVHVSSNAGCTPFEPLFTGTTGDPVDKVGYSWDFGDGATGQGDRVKHQYSEPDQKYDLTLTGLSSITGCRDTLSRKGYIWVYPKPVAGFSMDNKIVYNDKPTVNFSNQSTGGKEYSWDFGDGLTSDLKDPSHYYKVTGYRTVLMEVFNEFYCSDTVSHGLLVAFDRIFPPNGFSPNAPNPVDREFKLGSEGVSVEGYHLTIISRWNDVIFESKGEIKGWDGHTNNGSLAPAGVYLWVLDFTDFLGRKHRQTGSVTLVY
jgi:hypothetical protein